MSARKPARLVDVPAPGLRRGTVLVRTAVGAVSVGTERVAATHGHTSLIGKMRAHPDKVRQVIEMVRRQGIMETYHRVNEVLERWNATGYSCSGVVEAVGADVSEFRVGDRVACGGGGHAAHAGWCVIPRRLLARIPEGVALDEAAFATIGSIAMQGVRQAEIAPCDRVAVIGLGIVGQLASQIAAASGAIVTGMDLQAGRVELALAQGAASGIVIGAGDETEKALQLTDGRGFDVVLLAAATSSSDPVRLACAIARDRGRLVVVGDVGLNLDRQAMYDKELELRLSRSYGPGRYDPAYEDQGIDYPYGYVRWTEQRNMESVLSLLARGRLKVKPLITHSFPIAEVDKAYGSVVQPQGAPPIGIVLDYQALDEPRQTAITLRARTSAAKGGAGQKTVGIGFIGTGSFARSVLLPALRGTAAEPVAIASSTGVGPVQLGERHGFATATTDIQAVLDDARVRAVFIATRHDSHAQLVSRALAAGKAVFVEKPLAVDEAGVRQVCEAQAAHGGLVMVGFNRRFAPMTKKLKAFFGASHGPLSLSMRINAGPIAQHWSLSVADGGRIVGEGCHFVDLLAHVVGAPVTRVFASAHRVQAERLEETIAATLAFADGSVATLTYIAIGDTSLPKEHLEVFGDGKSAVLVDFTQLHLHARGSVRSQRASQDKGHGAELQAFIAAVAAGTGSPIPLTEAVDASLATLALLDSCRTGHAIDLQPTQERA